MYIIVGSVLLRRRVLVPVRVVAIVLVLLFARHKLRPVVVERFEERVVFERRRIEHPESARARF